ncbi:hypothetical protein BHM03_00041030 [Ensete ventricosum]|nr:hypothetical protein BHM03_00041030 [Ensete ventricosum]
MPRGTIWRELQLRFPAIDVGVPASSSTGLPHVGLGYWCHLDPADTAVLCQVSSRGPVGPAGYSKQTRWPPPAYISLTLTVYLTLC